MSTIRLGDLTVSDGHPCYFVAEIGGLFKNFDEAKRLINSAVKIGINAVKFQTLEADTITTKNNFFDLGVTGHISQYDFFKKFEPSKELQKQVIKYANDCGITVFSAPSHIKDVEFMEGIDVPIYKIGSDLACHIPLLKKVGHLGKPIILSTGMTTLEEVRDSINAIFETDQSILSSLDFEDMVLIKDDVYRNDDFNKNQPTLNFQCSIGLGSISLKWIKLVLLLVWSNPIFSQNV